ncbi:hypothetical protein QYS49_08445 [Marivirga salinae]|uniref:Uncharacterized protein n=1 Tax=Marivirga salinarum TaxID=3059078 RepID=A0AA49GEB9_9BACT|nr:hypothetical protein [Marivirga sp. BDSF4-3]WKK77213.2 hypothetical protein QYS49_08445 [Marivirga sp. BDSF4-3]
MKNVNLIFRLIKSVSDLRKFNNVNSRYHREAKAIINNLTDSFDLETAQNIPSNFKLKLQWYMAECLYACEKFNEISGRTSTSQQKRAYLLSGALGAMCDFIIDDVEMKAEKIKEFKNPKTEDQYTDVVEKLYALFYHSFINSLELEVKARVIQYYELIFDAQLKSKQQFNPSITQQEVDEICKNKCGYSLLYIRSLVTGEITEIEKKALYELGGYIQYCNDAQDLYKDLKKGLRTFASTRSDLETIARDLDKQKTIAFSLIKETPFDQKKKDELLFSLHIMSIGIIAKLNRYSKICDGNFSSEKLSKKSKEEVRSQLAIKKLLWYSFPKVIKYKYEDVDKSYDFQLNLNN